MPEMGDTRGEEEEDDDEAEEEDDKWLSPLPNDADADAFRADKEAEDEEPTTEVLLRPSSEGDSAVGMRPLLVERGWWEGDVTVAMAVDDRGGAG